MTIPTKLFRQTFKKMTGEYELDRQHDLKPVSQAESNRTKKHQENTSPGCRKQANLTKGYNIGD